MPKDLRSLEGPFGRLVMSETAGPFPAQLHAQHLVLIKQSGADGQFRVAGEPVPFTQADLVFVNARHSVEFERARAGAPTRFVACHFSVDWLCTIFPALFASAAATPFPLAHESITPRIRRLSDALVAEVVNQRFLSAQRVEFMLQELMLSIVETYVAKRQSAAAPWRGSRYDDERIRKALALLRAHPNKERSIDQLASQVGLSRSRFYDLFHACTGLSPRAYLDLLCVETAIAKLSGGRTRIAELSAELGFSAQSNFTRFFLNQVGVAPSQYRRAHAHAEAVDAKPSAGEHGPSPLVPRT